MIIAEVETKFRDAFAGNQIVRYNQVEANKQTVGNGLCTGLCLNWARQTIVTERSGSMVYNSPVVVQVQREFGQAKITETMKSQEMTKLAKIDKKRQDASHVFDNARRELNKRMHGQGGWDWEKEGGTAWDASPHPTVRKIVDQATERREAAMKECDLKVQALEDRARHVQWHWKVFLATMANTMKAEGTDYTDIALEHVAGQAEYAGPAKKAGLTLAFLSVVTNRSLTDGRVACVGLWEVPGTKQEGHMVAIFRKTSGVYHLFDPNIGVWEFAERPLVRAAAWLFSEAYPQLGGCADQGTYEYNNTAKAEYLIFSRKAGTTS
jgi:hypothetical protein